MNKKEEEMDNDAFSAVINDIHQERLRQHEKWGKQKNSNAKWLAILVEEVGEVAKALLERNIPHMRVELIQAAAVCVQWLASYK